MRAKRLSDDFHIYYETNRLWGTTSWLGVPTWKLPFDAWVIQELICKIKPDYIIETGTCYGGSAMFYASIMHLIDHGKVITVDTEDKINVDSKIAEHLLSTRIQFLHGSSIDPLIFKEIHSKTHFFKNMVILDSWHSKEHVKRELELYSPIVTVGSYLIVEDTHVNNHPVPWDWGSGPFEAVQEFLASTDKFISNEECEKLIMTFNPNGFLLRVK